MSVECSPYAEELRSCVEAMGKELQCGVCLCLLEDPKSLPCNHPYCKRCLEEVFEQNNGSCPQCRRVFNRRNVVADKTIQNITELFRKLHSAASTIVDLEVLSQGNHDWKIGAEQAREVIEREQAAQEEEEEKKKAQEESDEDEDEQQDEEDNSQSKRREKRKRISDMVVAKKSRMKVNSDSDDETTLARCSVCFISSDFHNNALLTCQSCEVKVHSYCYRVKFIESEHFTCDVCKANPVVGKKSARVRCCACTNTKDRAFKRTLTGSWIHASCALWLPGPVFVEDVVQDDLNVEPVRYTLDCKFCAGGGACLQCALCDVSYHVPCARRHGVVFEMRQAESGVIFNSLCSAHKRKSRLKSQKLQVSLATPRHAVSSSSAAAVFPLDELKTPASRDKNVVRKSTGNLGAKKKKRFDKAPMTEPRSKGGGGGVGGGGGGDPFQFIESGEMPTAAPSTSTVLTTTTSGGHHKTSVPRPLSAVVADHPKVHMVLTSTKLLPPESYSLQQFADMFSTDKCRISESRDGYGATHLITCARVAEHRVVPARTMKYFEAMLRQLWIMSVDWVLDSLHEKRILPEQDYVVMGDPVASGGAKRCRSVNTKMLFSNLVCYPAPGVEAASRQNMEHLLRLGGGVWKPSPEQVATFLQEEEEKKQGGAGAGAEGGQQEGQGGGGGGGVGGVQAKRLVVMLFDHARTIDNTALTSCSELGGRPASSQWLFSCLSNLAVMPVPPFRG